jgi:biotin operon repressor
MRKECPFDMSTINVTTTAETPPEDPGSVQPQSPTTTAYQQVADQFMRQLSFLAGRRQFPSNEAIWRPYRRARRVINATIGQLESSGRVIDAAHLLGRLLHALEGALDPELGFLDPADEYTK